MTGSCEDGPRVILIHLQPIILEVDALCSECGHIHGDIVLGQILFDIRISQFDFFDLCLKNILTIEFNNLVKNLF